MIPQSCSVHLNLSNYLGHFIPKNGSFVILAIVETQMFYVQNFLLLKYHEYYTIGIFTMIETQINIFIIKSILIRMSYFEILRFLESFPIKCFHDFVIIKSKSRRQT